MFCSSLQHSLCLHKSFHWHHFLDIPGLLGNAFSHMVMHRTKPIISCCGWCVKSNVPRISQHLSMVQILHSTFTICLSFVHIFIFTSSVMFLTFLNSMSIRIDCAQKPHHDYSCNTLSLMLIVFLSFLVSIQQLSTQFLFHM